MRTNSTSFKKAAGTLLLSASIVSAVFGLTACGTHGGGGFSGGGGRGGGGAERAYNAPLHLTHVIK